MAQDFGDDMGERLFRLIGRAAGYEIRGWLREQDYARRRTERDAQGADGTKVDGADAPTQPETVCIPFGTDEDAALFAKVAKEQKIQIAALSDGDHNGFVRFRTEDVERVQGCTDRFVEAMTRMNAERVAQSLENAQPVTEEQMQGLVPVPPDLAERTARAPEDVPVTARKHDQTLGAAERDARGSATAVSHTEDIADRVREAREQCRDFDDFKALLAERGIGVTTTKDGENMFYEARRDEQGRLLPFGRDETTGNRDWAVGAKTLKEHWEVDATHDWFERNTPKDPGGGPGSPAPMTERESRPAEFERTTVGPKRDREPQVADGSLDTDGRTPDLNQCIESHDGMDTDARTLRLEREQNGTDVAPSMVREEQEQALWDDRSLGGMSKTCTMSSKQLEAESGVTDRDIDISDKLNPVR